MPEQSPLDTLVATFIGAVLFSAVIAAVATGYHPPQSTLSANFPGAGPIALASASQTPTALPTATAAPPATPTPQPTTPPTATATTPPTPSAEPTAVIEPEDHYWFDRPIAAGNINFVSRFYAYGATYHGRYQVHHGVEFENPTGTPILAAGPGHVVIAGSDDMQVYGRFRDFYGRLVIIEHDRTFYGQPVFTLYGHVSTELVEVGQEVVAGQPIAEVGSAGVALGPHLHMEVRVGENSYTATRNPELWIKPFDGYGTIAGRLVDANGNDIPGVFVNLYDEQNRWYREAEAYGKGVNPDAGWRENFVFGDVPAGTYTVHYEVENAAYAEPVEVEAGQTAFIPLQVSEPSTETEQIPP